MRARTSLLVVAALAPACAEVEPPGRPSILLVSIDTLRADHLGLYGYERDTSPFLDAWAAREAVVYERAFTPAAWTLIAHMTMLTGFYPEQHGVVQADQALNAAVPLVAERLHAAGYQSIGLYFPSWVHERHGFGRGFDVFRPHQSAEEAGQHLFAELARRDPARPFFAFVHLFDVHSDPRYREPAAVYSAPAPYRELFRPGAAERLAGQNKTSLRRRQKTLSQDEVSDLVALYDEGIRHVDAQLERWFGRLEREGLLANTLVIITADHGESLAQRGHLGGHGGMWQEGVHVPLIVRAPDRARAGTRVAQSAHLIDVVPTLLAVAGLAPDARLLGHSLLAPLPEQRVLAGANPPLAYLLDWPQKLLRTDRRCVGVDLVADPDESTLVDVDAAVYLQLRATLGLGPTPLAPPEVVREFSEADREALRALGYAGEVDGK